MYCTNCGKEMDGGAAICLACGYAKNTGKKYCEHCGAEHNPNAVVCVSCGCSLGGSQGSAGAATGQVGDKAKTTAGLLYVLIGWLGIGDFYLGYTTKGIIKLALTLIGGLLVVGIVASIGWSIYDGVLTFQGKKLDAKGYALKD